MSTEERGRSFRLFCGWLLVASMLGCAPVLGVGGGLSFWGMAFLLSASLVFVSPVLANTSETTTIEIAQWGKKTCSTYTACRKGVVTEAERCCPKGARCNYRHMGSKKCGDDTCVEGYRAKCPPEVSREEKEICAKKTKQGKTRVGEVRWRIICDSSTNKLVKACAGVGRYPTNYGGPRVPIWRPFNSCGGDSCVPTTVKEGCASLKKPAIKAK